jgi:hypothetical protein
MKIYHQEKLDGLSEKITGSHTIAYATIATPDHNEVIKHKPKILASLNDADLYYVQSILVSSSWNKNDDIFDKAEVWQARHTPEDKPTNLEHDENLIIGHIVSNSPIDENGMPIDDNTEASELPDKFHILTGSVIYRAFTSSELKDRSEKLIAEIEDGTKYVSMECYFKGFDYGIINKSTGQYKILPRDNSTAYLTKYLRAYGGMGEHQDYKIGRVLRNITFSGKGFVDKPANPDSIIFTKDTINELLDKKNEYLSKSGVILDKSNSNVENTIMTENLEKQISELRAKLDTVKGAEALASELKQTNLTLQAAVKEKEEEMKKMKAAFDTEIEAIAKKMKEEEEKNEVEDKKESKKEEDKEEETEAAKKTKEEMAKKDEEMKKMKAAFDKEIEAIAKKMQDEKAMMDEEAKKTKSELDSVNEALAVMKEEKVAMLKKEKALKRKASLIELGFDNDTALATIEKFENLDDDSFAAMTSLFAGKLPPWLLDKTKKKEDKTEKKKASQDETVSALEEVEAEETVVVSVGSDETESQADSIRAELVEFVSARLSKNSK